MANIIWNGNKGTAEYSEGVGVAETPGRMTMTTKKRTTINMKDAVAQYRAGNNAGKGYAPYGVCDLIDECVAGLLEDGWRLVLNAVTSDDVTVLATPDGEMIAIGGDARGRGAWAVDLDLTAPPR